MKKYLLSLSLISLVCTSCLSLNYDRGRQNASEIYYTIKDLEDRKGITKHRHKIFYAVKDQDEHALFMRIPCSVKNQKPVILFRIQNKYCLRYYKNSYEDTVWLDLNFAPELFSDHLDEQLIVSQKTSLKDSMSLIKFSALSKSAPNYRCEYYINADKIFNENPWCKYICIDNRINTYMIKRSGLCSHSISEQTLISANGEIIEEATVLKTLLERLKGTIKP